MTTLPNKEIFDNVVAIMKYSETDEAKASKKADKNEYMKMMCEKFADFRAMMPMLFMSVAEQGTDFELRRLIDMLERRERIDNKETDVDTESKKIGKEYADEFVAPIVDKIR